MLAVLQLRRITPVRREEQNMVFRMGATALRVSFSIRAVIKSGPATLWTFKLASRLHSYSFSGDI